MMVSIAEVENLGVARVLNAALRAHGFHPLDPADGGLPGISCPSGLITIAVPQEEEDDAGMLARAILADI